MRLSILDYAQIDEGETASRAVKNTVKLAQSAEHLGYHRFWMAEHHDVPAFASSSPEMMMMHLLNQTKRMHIGSGGVMLPHYSPYKVAENFRLMQALHPNRVDLGIGSTIGTALVNEALNEKKEKKLPYRESVVDLVTYLTSEAVTSPHRFQGITANPFVESVPEIFLLSASLRSAKISAELGLGYTFGLFPLAGVDKLQAGIEAARFYRSHFQAGRIFKKPYVMIAPFIVLAATDREAEHQAKALDFWLLAKENFSYYRQFPTLATAESYDYTAQERALIERNRTRMVVGSPKSVKGQLDDLIEKFQADEVLVIPLMSGMAQRLNAIHYLAEAYHI